MVWRRTDGLLAVKGESTYKYKLIFDKKQHQHDNYEWKHENRIA